jgi:hypothetical protein
MLVLRTMCISSLASTRNMNELPISIHIMLRQWLGFIGPSERIAITYTV